MKGEELIGKEVAFFRDKKVYSAKVLNVHPGRILDLQIRIGEGLVDTEGGIPLSESKLDGTCALIDEASKGN